MATRSHCALAAALLVAMAATSTQSPHGEGEGRVVDGRPSALGQFPHQAVVLADGQYLCGGSLITRTAVLTGAFCTVGRKKFTIKLGSIHRDKNESTSWIVVAHWAAAHLDYKTEGYLSHNVAVIFLPEKAPLSIEDHSETLQYNEVTVIPNAVCEQKYEPGFILESTLCAGNENRGICSGDHGGPLVLKSKDGYKQIGIASFYYEKCEVPLPGGYSRVTYFLDWITRTAQINVT
ncbi:collagenase-like isoform X2 [Schistocerca americana]|uniref:collagenase-like isoform X2 n=1 Tax=Schistocerca americana TaxID=7009 RepID=UPI001F4FEB00|nr:collagenase-like isoform X2 [Schistocerca americana]